MEIFEKLKNIPPETLIQIAQLQYQQNPQTPCANETIRRESIDSPCTLGSSKGSRKKIVKKSRKATKQGVETFGVATTPGTKNSSYCFGSYTSTIGTIGTRIEYDRLIGEIRRTSAGTKFMDRLRKACFQIFRDHLHLPFLKIPLHLKKMVIQDIET